jgi:hypothetical protein
LAVPAERAAQVTRALAGRGTPAAAVIGRFAAAEGAEGTLLIVRAVGGAIAAEFRD